MKQKKLIDTVTVHTGLYSPKAYNALWLVRMMGDSVKYPIYEASGHKMRFLQHQDVFGTPWTAVCDIFRDAADGEICFSLRALHIDMLTLYSKVGSSKKQCLLQFSYSVGAAHDQLIHEAEREWLIGDGNSEVTLQQLPNGDIAVLKDLRPEGGQSRCTVPEDICTTLKTIQLLFQGEPAESSSGVVGEPLNPFAASAYAEWMKKKDELLNWLESRADELYFSCMLKTKKVETPQDCVNMYLEQRRAAAEACRKAIAALDFLA